MKPQEQKRKVIEELYSAGNRAAEILRVTKYAKATVYRVVKQIKAGLGISHSPPGPPKTKKRTPTFLYGLRRSVEANPAVSINALAAQRGIARSTVQIAVKHDLGLRSFIKGNITGFPPPI